MLVAGVGAGIALLPGALGPAVSASASPRVAIGSSATSRSPGAGGGVSIVASVAGRLVGPEASGGPVAIDPRHRVNLSIRVRNDSPTAVTIDSVRLSGSIVGMPLLSYSSDVVRTVKAADSEVIHVPLDLSELAPQLTGVLNGELSVRDGNRAVLAAVRFPVSIRGSLLSFYGAVALGIVLVTALLLVTSLLQLAAGTLPENRWSRAARFGLPAVGVGLTLTFSLSAWDVMALGPGGGGTVLVLSALIGLTAGFLTPTGPESDDENGEDLPRHSGIHHPRIDVRDHHDDCADPPSGTLPSPLGTRPGGAS